MRRMRLSEIGQSAPGEQVFSQILSGPRLYVGGVAFHSPGHVTHNDEHPHTHADQELFCLLQGEGWIEVDGVREPVRAGDLILLEPGEDHHLTSSEHNPLINLWLHANTSGHKDQFPT